MDFNPSASNLAAANTASRSAQALPRARSNPPRSRRSAPKRIWPDPPKPLLQIDPTGGRGRAPQGRAEPSVAVTQLGARARGPFDALALAEQAVHARARPRSPPPSYQEAIGQCVPPAAPGQPAALPWWARLMRACRLAMHGVAARGAGGVWYACLSGLVGLAAGLQATARLAQSGLGALGPALGIGVGFFFAWLAWRILWVDPR